VEPVTLVSDKVIVPIIVIVSHSIEY